MGTPKETLTADGLCLRQILGAPPQAWAVYVRPHPLGAQKTFPKKGFCGAFSLKKRPLRPQAPRKPLKFHLFFKNLLPNAQKCDILTKYETL